MAMRARHLYAMLCVLGLALPNAAFWPWLATHGLAPRRFVTDFLANGVSTFFGLDVILSACVLLLFVETEGRRLGLRRRWYKNSGSPSETPTRQAAAIGTQRQAQLDRATT